MTDTWERCDPECQGYGAFTVDRDPGDEIERCDECARFDDDDGARLQLVTDLEAGEPHAIAMVVQLLSGASEPSSDGGWPAPVATLVRAARQLALDVLEYFPAGVIDPQRTFATLEPFGTVES